MYWLTDVSVPVGWMGNLFSLPQVENTSIGWSLGYMLGMSNMIPSEVKQIPPMTNAVFAGLIFLFSALTIVTAVVIFIALVRTCFWECKLQREWSAAESLEGWCNPLSNWRVLQLLNCFFFSLSHLLTSTSAERPKNLQSLDMKTSHCVSVEAL